MDDHPEQQPSDPKDPLSLSVEVDAIARKIRLEGHWGDPWKPHGKKGKKDKGQGKGKRGEKTLHKFPPWSAKRLSCRWSGTSGKTMPKILEQTIAVRKLPRCVQSITDLLSHLTENFLDEE